MNRKRLLDLNNQQDINTVYKILFNDDENLEEENNDETDEDEEDFIENCSGNVGENDFSDSDDSINLENENIYIGKNNTTKWAKSAGRKNVKFLKQNIITNGR